MNERVKIFTFLSGHGETVVQTAHEEHINRWLAATPGTLLDVTQSESERPGLGHHITLCIWYAAGEEGAGR
jgi:hypothetical protein